MTHAIRLVSLGKGITIDRALALVLAVAVAANGLCLWSYL